MNERELDAEFERIISGWDTVAPDPTFDTRPETPPFTHPGGEASGANRSDAAQPVSEAPAPDAAGSLPHPHPHPGEVGDAEGPVSPDDPASSERPNVLGFPIAPGAESNVWRSAPRPHDDDDQALDSVPTDDADHFVPPTETDLPSAEDDPMFWAIVVGLAGGPLLLFYVLLFDRDGSGWWVFTALTMICVGFVLLVLRGGTERDPSDDGTRI